MPESRPRAQILILAPIKDPADYRIPALRLSGSCRRRCPGPVPRRLVLALRDGELAMASVPLTEEVLEQSDLVIITTDHSHIDYSWVVERVRHVLDTRYATRGVKSHRERITLL